METLLKLTESPEAFEKGNSDIWLDPERQEFVLQSHLDDRIDGASKNEEFIKKKAPVNNYPKVVDLGCGPGLYSEQLARNGYEVTGIDFAENSIKYAKDQASKKDLPIEYRCEDFLQSNLNNEFDLALIIYQIFGILEPKDRKKLLQNISNNLRPGGLVLLDVLSQDSFDRFEEMQVWSRSRKDSPVSKERHVGLISTMKYPNKVTLQKSILIFGDGKLVNYNYWNQHFSIQDLEKEANEAGLILESVYADVNGEAYHEGSEFIAAILKKSN